MVKRGTSATTEVAAEVLAAAGACRASRNTSPSKDAPRRWRKKFSRPAGANSVRVVNPGCSLVPRSTRGLISWQPSGLINPDFQPLTTPSYYQHLSLVILRDSSSRMREPVRLRPPGTPLNDSGMEVDSRRIIQGLRNVTFPRERLPACVWAAPRFFCRAYWLCPHANIDDRTGPRAGT